MTATALRAALLAFCVGCGARQLPTASPAEPAPPSSPEAVAASAEPSGAELYARYCALCHGADREGYAADNAPSLRSPELMASVPIGTLWQAIS